MKRFASLFYLIFFSSIIINVSAQSAFINEVNYLANNPQEGIEIAGQAGQDLTGWNLLAYGSGGDITGATPLTGYVIPDNQNGYGSIWMEVSQSDQGNAIALVDAAGSVAQFISYGLAGLSNSLIVTATEGPAAGMTSDYIGQQLLPFNSLQLGGSGNKYEDFFWNIPNGATPSDVNSGQLFTDLLFLNGANAGIQQAAPETEIGTGTVAEGIEWTVFPNPATDRITIRWIPAGNSPIVNVKLSDQQGRILKQTAFSPNSGDLSVDLQDLVPGNYIITLNDGQRPFSKMIVKR